MDVKDIMVYFILMSTLGVALTDYNSSIDQSMIKQIDYNDNFSDKLYLCVVVHTNTVGPVEIHILNH